MTHGCLELSLEPCAGYVGKCEGKVNGMLIYIVCSILAKVGNREEGSLDQICSHWSDLHMVIHVC